MMYKVTVVFKDKQTPQDVTRWPTKEAADRVAAEYLAGRGLFSAKYIERVDVDPITRGEAIAITRPTSKVYEETWRTQEGRVLRVCDMTEDHVRATLNMILGNRRKKAALKKSLKELQEWMDDALDDDAKWGGRKS